MIFESSACHFYSLRLEPIAKERPRMRVVRAGGRIFSSAYTPQKTKTYEKLIAKLCREQMDADGNEPFEDDLPLKLEVIFYLPRPKGHGKQGPKYHTKTPDLDNLVKALLDGMQGVVFPDDKAIVSLSCQKGYADLEGPHVTVQVTPLGDSENGQDGNSSSNEGVAGKPRSRKKKED